MFYKTLNWYRGLSKGWKAVAWIVVAVVAIGSFVVLALPWLMNKRLRENVRKLKSDAEIGAARHKLDEAKKTIKKLEGKRDTLLANEARHANEEAAVDRRINEIDSRLAAAQKKIKEQTDEEQGAFFDRRYGG